jgi:hypothetical protein
MLRLDSPNASLDADGTIELQNGFTLGQGSYQPVLRTPAPRGFRLVSSLKTEYDGVLSRALANELSTSLVFSRAGRGAWIGGRANPSRNLAPVAGLWRQVGSRGLIAVSSSIERTELVSPVMQFDSIYTDTSGWQRFPRCCGNQNTAQSRLRWMASEARFSWGRGRVSFDATADYRSRIDSIRHASFAANGYATLALRSGVAFSLGAGTMSRDVNYGGPVGRFFSASVKLAPAALLRPRQRPEIMAFPTAFSIGELTDGEYEVRIRLPQARVVELAGDFNEWKPIRLSQTEADTWRVALHLKPGTYHMNIRVDGATWIAPPGVPSVADEFNGQVGLIIIR